jgi:hypothetical protein
MGRVTLGWRFKQQARYLLAEHKFDILHFHEPFVPFLSPTVLDQSDTVNIATFHAFGGFSPSYWVGKRFAGRLNDKLHGRIAVSGAARHFISRYFPGDYRIIPNGVDLDRFADAEPFEELRDGTINILFVGRFEERKGLIHLLRAYHRLRKRHVDAAADHRLGAEAARVPALHRAAPDPRRPVPGRSPMTPRRATSPAPISSAPRRRAELRDRPPRGDGRSVPIVASDIPATRTWSSAVQGSGRAAQPPRAGAALYRLSTTLSCAIGWATRGAKAPEYHTTLPSRSSTSHEIREQRRSRRRQAARSACGRPCRSG